jgi:hypothetical protein
MCQVHVPTLDENSFLVDGEMNQFSWVRTWSGVADAYSGPVVEHFWSKSFAEFLIKKRRGETLAIKEGQFLRDFFQFFAWTAPLSNQNLNPISNIWIEKVEQGARDILSNSSIGEAYREVVERHRAHLTETENDASLHELYDKLLKSTKSTM